MEAKPLDTIEWIFECVSDNLLFLKLDRDQKERVVQRMQLIPVKKGNFLIKQGESNAQTFYVTESGTFDILVDMVKVGQYKRGGCFGELALLYDSPRAASIVVYIYTLYILCVFYVPLTPNIPEYFAYFVPVLYVALIPSAFSLNHFAVHCVWLYL